MNLENNDDIKLFFQILQKEPELKFKFLKSLQYLAYLDGRKDGDDILLSTINNQFLQLSDDDYAVLQQIQSEVQQEKAGVKGAVKAFAEMYDGLIDSRLKATFYRLSCALMFNNQALSTKETRYYEKISATHGSNGEDEFSFLFDHQKATQIQKMLSETAVKSLKLA